MAEANPTPPPFKIITVFPRVWKLMTKREKQKSGILFLGTIVNSFVEILGLAAVVPVIGLVIEPELIRTNQYLAKAFEWSSVIGIDTERRFLMLTSVLLVAAFLFKAIFNLGLNLFQTRFSLGIGHRISGLMWEYHFAQSLERMRMNESGQIMTEIGSWPISLSDKFIVGGMRLINEFLVIGIIAFGLIFYEPVVLICVSLLLLVGAVIIKKMTKDRLDSYSKEQKILVPQTSTIMNNAIKGFLEVVTFKASSAMQRHYLQKTLLLIRIMSNSQIMAMAPSKLYEVLAVTAVSAAIFVSLLLQNSNHEFINLLILMALSAYRIMPSMSRINGQIMAMRQFQYILIVVENAISNLSIIHSLNKNPSVSLDRIDLEIEEISVGYESLNSPVLNKFSAVFNCGSVNAIVGPSGSGKSTLVNTILGLHQPYSGKIYATEPSGAHYHIGNEISLPNWLEHISYLSQSPYLFNGTVRENLTMMIPQASFDEKFVDHLLEKLDLRDCLGPKPLEFQLHEGGSNLSGGQQQRLAILRAIRLKRPVLILDEATSALDGLKRDHVFELLREIANEGVNVILITHDNALAQQCDSILDLGKLNE